MSRRVSIFGLFDIDSFDPISAIDKAFDEMGADKASSAGDQYSSRFHFISFDGKFEIDSEKLCVSSPANRGSPPPRKDQIASELEKELWTVDKITLPELLGFFGKTV